MATKTEYLIGELRSIEAQAANRVPANALIASVSAIRRQVEARKELGEDPDITKLSGLYASVSGAVAAFNSYPDITIPSEEDVAAAVEAADSAVVVPE
tara:strand:- start:1680 stop:1973 length:294 start_codon:yes stop_codon:yes gene_type:complete